MVQLQSLVPAFGANAPAGNHGVWPLLLLLVVFVMAAPIAYLMGNRGGRPDDGPPLRP